VPGFFGFTSVGAVSHFGDVERARDVGKLRRVKPRQRCAFQYVRYGTHIGETFAANTPA
jgi:hypothetical protein